MNKILLSFWFFSLSLYAMAQEIESPHLRFNFQVGTSRIDPHFGENQLILERLDKVLAPSNLIYIKAIRVSGGASPEGPLAVNQKLSSDRMYAINSLLSKRNAARSFTLTTDKAGIDWEGLRELVEADPNTPRRKEILYIIDNVPEADFARNVSRRKSLMELGVPTWNYLLKHHFPVLRSSAAVIIYLMPDTPQERIDHINAIITGETTEIDPPVVAVIDTPITPDTVDTVFTETVIQQIDTLPVETPKAPEYKLMRPLALKTNLLYDLATALNVEVEVPIASRWSIAGEWVFPWWLWERKQHAFQLLQGSLEARYWLKPNLAKQDTRLGTHNPLAGWFVGLYGGGGYYDLEWDKKGYQGEFFIATGLSGGYVMPLSRNFSLEFSLGVGYLKTKYRGYEALQDAQDEWHLYRREQGVYTWIGPTKAKISFIWYPHFKAVKKKGGIKQ